MLTVILSKFISIIDIAVEGDGKKVNIYTIEE